MNGDAFEMLGNRRKHTADIIAVGCLPEGVKGPGGVLARRPGDQNRSRGHHGAHDKCSRDCDQGRSHKVAVTSQRILEDIINMDVVLYKSWRKHYNMIL